MKLHEFTTEFRDLISIVAADKHLPESAIERDYYIVLLLKNLADSEYVEKCVFKGGTSLSKCYPGSIESFSEDIDLTFLGIDESDKVCDRTTKVRLFDIENAVTTLKELAENGQCTMPKYDFARPDSIGYDSDGNPKWACTCSIVNDKIGITESVYATSKKDAKNAQFT